LAFLIIINPFYWCREQRVFLSTQGTSIS
jgi:hypothetical protein